MALYRLALAVAGGISREEVSDAAAKAGFTAEVSAASPGRFEVLIKDERNDFSTGKVIAESILALLPEGVRLDSVTQAISVFDLSEEDIAAIALAEMN